MTLASLTALHSWPTHTTVKGDRIYWMGVVSAVVGIDWRARTFTLEDGRVAEAATGPYASTMGYRALPTCDDCGLVYTAESAEAFYPKRRSTRHVGPCCVTDRECYPDGFPHPDSYSEAD